MRDLGVDPKSVKVLHLLNVLKPSGMEQMMVSAHPTWAAAEIESLIVGQGQDHPFREELEQAGMEILTVESIRSLRGMIQLYSCIKVTRPDVIHIHTEGTFAPAVLISKLAYHEAAIVRTIHSVFLPRGKAWVSRKLQSFIADRFVASFIAPSPAVAANEVQWGRRCETILNWVHERFLTTARVNAPETDLAVLVGNCSSIKDHELAIRALSNTGYRLAHVGDDSHISPSEANLLDSLSRENRLVHQASSDPLPFLRSGTVFLLPSRLEGFSVALAEAVAVGIPVVANDIEGIAWVRDAAKVRLVAPELGAWETALGDLDRISQKEGHHLDLSPRRGALQYAAVYQQAIKAGGKWKKLG